MSILDYIFPKTCVNCRKIGDHLCDNCFSLISFEVKGACAVCNRPSINFLTHPGCLKKFTIDGVFTSIAYKGIVKKLIYKFKYKPYLSDLRQVLIDLLYEGIIQQEEFMKTLEKTPILVPIPLHKSRLKSRGYNQAEILAIGLSKKLNLQVYSLLKRVKQTHSQVGLAQKERQKNVKGAFILNTKHNMHSTNVLLIDDVFTTGSTLLEAANRLKRNGASKVWGIALSRG